MRLLPDEDGAGRRVGLKPRRGVHGVAEGGVFDPAAGADRADDDAAGVHANTHTEPDDAPATLHFSRELSDVVEDPQAGADRPFCVILVRDGGSEEREHPVAGQVLHDPAEALDRTDHPRHRIGHDQLQVLGIEVFPERGRADDIREERGDVAPFLA